MSIEGSSPLRFTPARSSRKPPLRVILRRGDDVRAFNVRPRLAAITCIASAIFGILYFTATGYLVFRDDLLAASLARQVRLQQAYEDRVASLRADIDRLTSRQLLNQEAFEVRLEQLLGRQAALDERQDIIAGLSQTARGAGLMPAAVTAPLPRLRPRTGDEADDELITGSIAPEPSTVRLAAVSLRKSTTTAPLPATDEATRIVAVESSLDALARDQVDYIEHIANDVTERSVKIAEVLERLGHKTDVDLPEETGIGGPFMPLDEDADPHAFRSNADLIANRIEQFAVLRETAAALPLGKPMASAPITSKFGARMDPFLKRPAMHSGIDFKAASGNSVFATAGGKVVSAGRNGGYGNMVEIDHGRGVTTRYAHLSRLLVKKGEHVDAGTLVGRTGSTGRSTGPHLHYEVRINKRAIDPMKYLRAGADLSALL